MNNSCRLSHIGHLASTEYEYCARECRRYEHTTGEWNIFYKPIIRNVASHKGCTVLFIIYDIICRCQPAKMDLFIWMEEFTQHYWVNLSFAPIKGYGMFAYKVVSISSNGCTSFPSILNYNNLLALYC